MKNYLLPYLKRSADINYQTALNNCSHNHVDNSSCMWYHGAWQYLRLLDVVSSPSWHHKFYLKNLCKSCQDKIDVLISGLADYSMYAYVLLSAKRYHCSCNVTAIDLCKTPLLNAKWYAEQMNEKITLEQKNIFDVTGRFDLICADAFLTRFQKVEMIKVLQKWHALLKDDGKFVTTIRIHDSKHIIPIETQQLAIEKFVKKTVSRAKKYPNLKLSINEIRTLAQVYAKSMKSNKLGDKLEIIDEIQKQGFDIIHMEEAQVVGELYPSKYIRIVAQKS